MATNIEKKITKQMKLSAIINHFKDIDASEVLDWADVKVDGEEQRIAITAGMVLVFAEHEIELLNKRKSTSGKSGEDELANAILDYMAQNPTLVVSTTDVIKHCPACEGLNTQKVAPRLNALAGRGVLTKVKEKGKTFWQYAGQDIED